MRSIPPHGRGSAFVSKENRRRPLVKRLDFHLHEHVCIAITSTASMPSSACGGIARTARTREHAFNVGIEKSRRAPATRSQVEGAASVPRRRKCPPGRMEILYVLPDYFEQFPSPAAWVGPRLHDRAADGAVLPCQTAREIRGLHSTTRAITHSNTSGLSRCIPQVSRTDWLRSLPKLPAQGDRLRRLPLPGIPAGRRRRPYGPRLLPLAHHRFITEALAEADSGAGAELIYRTARASVDFPERARPIMSPVREPARVKRFCCQPQ